MATAVRRVRLSTLRIHPLNAEIYDDRPIDDLVDSIVEHGLLEPLVASRDRVIVSGHRRYRALRQLGIKLAPARLVRFEDDAVALVEFNRSRSRTWSERYRELQVLLPRLQAVAAERRADGARRGAAARHGLPMTKIGHRHGRSRVYEEIGRISGLGRESARKLLRVFEAIDEGIVPAKVGEQLDRGDLSLNKAYIAVRRAQGQGRRQAATAAGKKAGLSFEPLDVWYFHKRDRSYDLPGDDGSGTPPPQAWQRLIELYTDAGDLILDPMARTGTVGRVCEAMGRRCDSFDIEPGGSEVRRHDLLKGSPPVDEPARLVILDPPYFAQKRYSRRTNALGGIKELPTYLERLGRCIDASVTCLSPGGGLALVIGNDSCTNSEDLAWQAGMLMRRYGEKVKRIWLPYAPQIHPPYRVRHARSERALLTLQREVLVLHL